MPHPAAPPPALVVSPGAGAPARAAGADRFTLHLAVPEAVVGVPVVLRATGTIPVAYLAFRYYYSAVAISPRVARTCPAERYDGLQLATSTGGAVLVLSGVVVPGPTGRFSHPIGATPTSAGVVLLCAYVDDGETTTLARASARLVIQPAVRRPVNLRRPRVVPAGAWVVCAPGRWAHAPRRLAFAWRLDGARRSGLVGRRLRRAGALAGHRVACRVTATNAAGSAAAWSAAVRIR